MHSEPIKLIAIASGKGGVGKSLLASSLGIYLSQIGNHVILVDAHVNSSNLHTLLGMQEPLLSLQRFWTKHNTPLETLLTETPFRGLSLLSSYEHTFSSQTPNTEDMQMLAQELHKVSADHVIIDLGNGSDESLLELFLASDICLIMTQPEPTAIESAFHLIKRAFLYKHRALKGLEWLLDNFPISRTCGLPTPHQLYQFASKHDPEISESLHQAMIGFKPRLVVNNIRTRDDLELSHALTVIGRRHLTLPMDYIGYIENNEVVLSSVQKRRPLLVEHTDAKISKDIERIARRILALESAERPECLVLPKPMEEQTHYEILNLAFGATEDEIRKTYRRVRRLYQHDSPAIYGVAPPDELLQMPSRIEDACNTLVDRDKRQHYNQKHFQDGMVNELHLHTTIHDPAKELDDHPIGNAPNAALPNEPQLNEETEYTGAILRQIRESRNIEIKEIAERTKISPTYLRAIEGEMFKELPESVFVQGFLKLLARDLKLNPKLVSHSYMARYHAAFSPSP